MTPDEFKGHVPAPLFVSESLDARASNRMLDIAPSNMGQPINDAETMQQGAAAIRTLLSDNIKLTEANAELQSVCDGFVIASKDIERLAREIDVAMHGEDGAAKQASLCDLVGPAADLRADNIKLREALEMIVKQADDYDDDYSHAPEDKDAAAVHMGNIARTALGKATVPVQAAMGPAVTLAFLDIATAPKHGGSILVGGWNWTTAAFWGKGRHDQEGWIDESDRAANENSRKVLSGVDWWSHFPVRIRNSSLTADRPASPPRGQLEPDLRSLLKEAIEALEQIASCDSHHPDDVVAIARRARSIIQRSKT